MSEEQRFYKLVGARIRELRLAKGLSQGDVAKAIRSYQQNVARSEAGTNLTLDVIYRLAIALDVEPVEFFKVEKRASARKPRSG